MIFSVNFFLEWSEDFLWFTNLPEREIIPTSTSTIVTNLATDEFVHFQFYIKKKLSQTKPYCIYPAA